MTCRECDRKTGGIDLLADRALPLCRACLAKIRRSLGSAKLVLDSFCIILRDLDVSPRDEVRVSEAPVWSPRRRDAWDRLAESDRLYIKAMAHVVQLFGDDNDLRFVEMPKPVLACIKRCSRAALFTTMGECLRLTLGDFDKLPHVMKIFGYEHFDRQDPPEPLASQLRTGSRDELFSVLVETLDVLLGTNGMRRIKAIRAWHRNGGIGPRPKQRYRSGHRNTDADSDDTDDSDDIDDE